MLRFLKTRIPRVHSRTLVGVIAVLIVATGLSVRSQSPFQIGYTVVTADVGTSLPLGVALFSYTNASGVLVSQAGVGAVEPVTSGRILVDETGTQTGIALTNASLRRVTMTLVLRDASGREVDRKDQTLEAQAHMARYVRELFPGTNAGFVGSLTFQSVDRIAAIALRESRNGQGEPLYTTLPVSAAGQADNSPVVFPHIAAGGGYRTQLVLMNSTNQIMRGKIQLTSSDGTGLALQLGGVNSSEFSYEIAPQGTFRGELDKSGTVGAGYAILTPDPGNASPSGTAIFQYWKDNLLITEAGVAATMETPLARIFVDNAGTNTGVAIANPATQAAQVTFNLLDRYGALLDTTTRTLPARNHLARFAHELFPRLSHSFTGLLEIGSTLPVNVVTLRLTENSRREQVLTTAPVADMTRLSSSASLTFPHVVNGGGFSTRLVFISTNTASETSGTLSFYESTGLRMVLMLGGKSGSEFVYKVTAGGGKQFLPGNSGTPARIELIDPVSDRTTGEVVVNEGNSLRATLRVRDSSGVVRDDFDLNYGSLSPEIATVDSTGAIAAKTAGFSTLTIESGGVVATGTITVVRIDAGVPGFESTGIVQDLSRRLYLANTSDHTILRTESVQQTPQVYAGVTKTAGLKNTVREQSLFRNPAFLAIDQSDGSLYVSDGANHVVRRVRPGPAGEVETLAGSEVAGSNDGLSTGAAFRNPQGIQLDPRGNLWVVDSGNHTIRRIRLSTGVVETISGKAGSAGWVDGSKEEARFSSPKGIALETEPPAQQLARERRGDPPPPVSLLVADTGNGVIRRVTETGEVQTIQSGDPSAALRSPLSQFQTAAPTPLLFDSPEGIALDFSGSIFVTEPASGRVWTVLPNGNVVAAAQANTFRGPRGLAITRSGRVVVAESNLSAREISYGEPQITSITPGRVSARGGSRITIKGTNFAPGTRIAIAGTLIVNATIADTQTISATVPVLPSGYGTVTVENRGGLAQAAILVDAIPLSELLPGQITTVAGGSTYLGDGGAAVAASLSEPADIAVDPLGNLLIADTNNNRIRKVHAATGVITTFVGTGIEGSSGDGGPAFLAQLNHPAAVAVDPAGNVLIADGFGRDIRRVEAATGIITTLVRSGMPSNDIALDSTGNIFLSEGDINFNGSVHRVRRIDIATGISTIVAGTGVPGYSGDGGPATLAQFGGPVGIVLDRVGNLFIADSSNHVIRKVDTGTLTITTIAGTGIAGFRDGSAATAQFKVPGRIALDTEGNLFIAEGFNFRIRKLSLSSGIVTTVAGSGQSGFSGDNGPATAASLRRPSGVALDSSGNVLIVDYGDNRVRRVDNKTSVITTIVGIGATGSLGDNGPATDASLNYPDGIAVDASGNLVVVDSRNNKIRKVDMATGTITTIAGTGQSGFAGDNASATSALLSGPLGVALDGQGNIYFTDTNNSRVRKITTATGIITTVAGSGVGSGGDNGLATLAQFHAPAGIALDADGNYFVADRDNHRIRRIDARTNIITTVAGNGSEGFSGDTRLATTAQLSFPVGVAVDASGNLLIADSGNGRIRKVWAATRIITTVAGNGATTGRSDDNILATASRVLPQGVLADSNGTLFIAGAGRIRRVDAVTGIITTIAGMDRSGFSGDGGNATGAQLGSFPVSLALGSDGTLFVSDKANLRIRAIRGPIR